MSLRKVKLSAVILAATLILSVLSISAKKRAYVYSGCPNENMKIALSFDDGPHKFYTPEILDILKEYNVHATFFVLGSNVERFPELLKREIDEGHEIGNHTYYHSNIAKAKENKQILEIIKCENAIYEIDEYRPKLFRPPEGSYTNKNAELLKRLDYSIILWSVDTRDWTHMSSKKIIANVLKKVKSGDIILFHDFISKPSPTPEALRVLIPELQKRGYTFVTVSELISGE